MTTLTDVQMIRLLISDPVQFDQTSAVSDGTAVDFEVANAPVVAFSQKVYVNGSLKVAGVDYTIDADIGVVTFTAAPASGQQVVVTYQWSLLSDNSLSNLLAFNGSVRYAAAGALDIIASSETLIQKVITTNGLSTNGPAVAASLRAHAASLRQQEQEGAFAIAEMVLTPSGWRERILNEWQRLGL